MPRATVSQETQRYELRSLEGAYVVLRTLSFHEMQTRQDMAMRMYTENEAPDRRKNRKKIAESVRSNFEMMNVAVTEYEFRNCIVEHNLEDENESLIDFTRPMGSWRLDPKVGQEINNLIDDLNQWDEEYDLDPLETPASSSSSAERSLFPISSDEV